jgi:methylenetetrahydrofolate--tRNA-(uracil-5-)-methyltransferase
MGLVAGINAGRAALGLGPLDVPPATAHGALLRHLIASDAAAFQPSNVNFGLFPPVEGRLPKKERGRLRAEIALGQMRSWRQTLVAA